jgi:hypothetical protein
MVKKAVVTLAFGPDKPVYDSLFLPTIKAYCKKHNYDYIEINEPFDKDIRIMNSKPGICMQRLLICSQPWSSQYDYIVMFDSDILVNVNQAPDIIEGIPEGKIGAVCERKLFKLEFSQKVWSRWRPDLPQNGEEYYKKYGYPEGFQNQLNGGVMVYQPKHHAEFLSNLYKKYTPDILNGNRQLNDYDQDILSYHIQKEGLIHWLDERWNMVWVLYQILLYPFLNPNEHKEFLKMALGNLFDLSYVVHMAGHVGWDLLMN